MNTNVVTYPDTQDVFAAIEAAKPKGYEVTFEYPGYTSIRNEEVWGEDYEIAVGDADDCFGWSDTDDQGGLFFAITEPKEIAQRVWDIVKEMEQ